MLKNQKKCNYSIWRYKKNGNEKFKLWVFLKNSQEDFKKK